MQHYIRLVSLARHRVSRNGLKLKTCLNRRKDVRLIVGFTLQAKLVSSKHLIQVHLKISSRTLENLASHLVTKYTLEAQAVNHRSR